MCKKLRKKGYLLAIGNKEPGAGPAEESIEAGAPSK